MTRKNLAIAAGIIACIAMCFASATISPFKELTAEIITKLQGNQFTQSAANQVKIVMQALTGVDLQDKRQNTGGRSRAASIKLMNCTSEFNENCNPSVQLASTGLQWSAINTTTQKYNTKWICKDEYAFVSCGMNFTYDDQKLYVPVCGIYKIYGQILFLNFSASSAVVHHKVEVNRNCINLVNNNAEFYSYASVVPVPVGMVPVPVGMVPVGMVPVGWATTVNLAMVKMCAGGSVSVVIPSVSACCAVGDRRSTHFSIHLSSQVDCDSI